MGMKHGWLALAVVMACLAAGIAAAEELTAACTFTATGNEKMFGALTDGNLGTYYPFTNGAGKLTAEAPSPIGGVAVELFDRYNKPLSYDLQVRGADGSWTTVAQGGEYLCEWFPLEQPAAAVRIVCTSAERLRIAELRLFGPGEKPDDVLQWETLDKADLMLLTAHPDDEMLWFGGLLPTYAGERGLKVQVAVLVPTGGERKLELLHALWTCGVRAYPAFLGFIDKSGSGLKGQYAVWRGEDMVLSVVCRCFRRYKPEVVVTHGERGEYGHNAHRVAADAAKRCYRLAANPGQYTRSVREYGEWQVKKLYLHEYGEGQIVMDWTVPLAAFGGRTGYEVAADAFSWHHSQVERGWAIEEHGEHDNALFGLWRSEVGPDSGTGDLMEHIP